MFAISFCFLKLRCSKFLWYQSHFTNLKSFFILKYQTVLYGIWLHVINFNITTSQRPQKLTLWPPFPPTFILSAVLLFHTSWHILQKVSTLSSSAIFSLQWVLDHSFFLDNNTADKMHWFNHIQSFLVSYVSTYIFLHLFLSSLQQTIF